LWSLKKIDLLTAIKYILAQLVGAGLAIYAASAANLDTTAITITPPTLFELVGMILFTFSIGAVVYDDKKSVVSGLIIGGALTLGISISVLGGAAGILNPAVAVALKTTDIGYYAMDIIGGIIGLQLYAYLASHFKR
jgi:hypothetical protein